MQPILGNLTISDIAAMRGRRRTVSGVIVDLGDGAWAVDTDPAAAPDAFIVADGAGGFQIDTLASSGLPIVVYGGRPYIVE